MLASTFELREYAARADRSFEGAVMEVVLSALLATMVPKIEYQVTSTGSIFDFCKNRADIVKSIQNPHIDPKNRVQIPADLLEPVENILKVLIEYKGGPPLRRTRGALKKKAALKNPPGPTHESVEASRLSRSAEKKTPPSAATTFLDALAALNAALREKSSASASKPAARRTVRKRSARSK